MKTNCSPARQLALGTTFLAALSTGCIAAPGDAASSLSSNESTVLTDLPSVSPEAPVGTWRPKDGQRLQDFAVFAPSGAYGPLYVMAMSASAPSKGFRFAETWDGKQWNELANVLPTRRWWSYDASMVWAPHVIQHEGVHYAFYTGVTNFGAPGGNNEFRQTIMIATSTKPGDPGSWAPVKFTQTIQGTNITVDAFRPTHAGAVWPPSGKWADCRDPMVLRGRDGLWHMYYTGRDVVNNAEKGVAGHAVARHPLGPWQDLPPVLTLPMGTPESIFVMYAPSGRVTMVFNHAKLFWWEDPPGPRVATAATPNGPFVAGGCLDPAFAPPHCKNSAQLTGWAHEFLQYDDGQFRAAFLTGYYVTLRKATWVGDLPRVPRE